MHTHMRTQHNIQFIQFIHSFIHSFISLCNLPQTHAIHAITRTCATPALTHQRTRTFVLVILQFVHAIVHFFLVLPHVLLEREQLLMRNCHNCRNFQISRSTNPRNPEGFQVLKVWKSLRSFAYPTFHPLTVRLFLVFSTGRRMFEPEL